MARNSRSRILSRFFKRWETACGVTPSRSAMSDRLTVRHCFLNLGWLNVMVTPFLERQQHQNETDLFQGRLSLFLLLLRQVHYRESSSVFLLVIFPNYSMRLNHNILHLNILQCVQAVRLRDAFFQMLVQVQDSLIREGPL